MGTYEKNSGDRHAQLRESKRNIPFFQGLHQGRDDDGNKTPPNDSFDNKTMKRTCKI